VSLSEGAAIAGGALKRSSVYSPGSRSYPLIIPSPVFVLLLTDYLLNDAKLKDTSFAERRTYLSASRLLRLQLCLYLIRHPSNVPDDILAYRCVGYLGKSHIYSFKHLWTFEEGPNAAGLLRDPTFKLINLLNRSRTPAGLDSAKLSGEVVRCERIWNGLDPDGTSVAPVAPVAPAPGLEHTGELFFTPSTSGNTSGAAGNNAGGDV
jgi:hypothetical protein